MNQATLADQGVLRNFQECGKDADLDRHLGLHPRCHRQKQAELPRSLYKNLPTLSLNL